jgi:hypothetical protein
MNKLDAIKYLLAKYPHMTYAQASVYAESVLKI